MRVQIVHHEDNLVVREQIIDQASDQVRPVHFLAAVGAFDMPQSGGRFR